MNNKKKMFWIRPVVRPTYQKCNQQTSKRTQKNPEKLLGTGNFFLIDNVW